MSQVNLFHQFFPFPKKDGSARLILNLKKLNAVVEFSHFKMETIHTILQLVTQNCWMSSVDLKDAYYSVKVSSKFQKFLKFFHEGKLYKFTAWPNGLSPCPRKFTKILKPPFANLRLLGHIISGHLDDSFLQGKTYDACVKNTIDTIIMLDKLGQLSGYDCHANC